MAKKENSNEIKRDSRGRKLLPNEDQMEDGRYRYRYIDKNGKRRPIYSWKLVPSDKIPKGKKDDISLREKEKQIQKDIDDKIDSASANITVYELLQKYFSILDNANTTMQNYVHITEKHIKPNFIGSMAISKVKKSDILKFYAVLRKEKNFAVGTIQLYQNILFPAFQLAVDDSVIRLNPCKGCMKKYKQGGLGSTKTPLTRWEQNILLDFLKNESVYYGGYYAIISFMLGTGARIGECLGLTWDDIDFEKGCVTIDHQLTYAKKNGRYQFYASPPKHCEWGDGRVVPLQPCVLSVLREYRDNTYFISMASDYSVSSYEQDKSYSNFVFINREGKVSKPDSFVRAFHGIRDERNELEKENAIFENREPKLLSDFTPHVLRHTYCTRMAENGIDIKVLQELMGHKNIQVTMQVYNHVNENRSISEVSRIQDVLGF